jgi:tetratricopeptide (TPR) repeat protein
MTLPITLPMGRCTVEPEETVIQRSDLEGAMALNRYNYKEAEMIYARILNTDPCNEPALSGYAESLRGLGMFEKAAIACEEWCRMHPDSAEAHISASVCYHAAAQLDKAITHATEAARLAPSTIACYQQLVNVYSKAHEFEAAEAALNKMGELGADEFTLLVQRGYITLDKRQYEQALDLYGRAAQMAPSSEDAQYGMAWAHFRMTDFEAARAAFKQALKLKPNFPDALQGLAFSELRLKNNQAAIQAMEKLIEVSPQDEGIYVDLARTYLRSGNLRGWWRTIKRAGQAGTGK